MSKEVGLHWSIESNGLTGKSKLMVNGKDESEYTTKVDIPISPNEIPTVRLEKIIPKKIIIDENVKVDVSINGLRIFKVYASEEAIHEWNGNFYDEFFGHVVIAENEEEALDIAYDKGLIVPKYKATVEEIIMSEKGIVLSDFNAG